MRVDIIVHRALSSISEIMSVLEKEWYLGINNLIERIGTRTFEVSRCKGLIISNKFSTEFIVQISYKVKSNRRRGFINVNIDSNGKIISWQKRG